MRVLVTGADGFIGRNLCQHLLEMRGVELSRFTRQDAAGQLHELVAGVDVVFHLAGVNRPSDQSEFVRGNLDLTRILCETVAGQAQAGREPARIVYTSSIQVERDNPYGRSKLAAEQVLADLSRRTGCAVGILRLPNVFGKWCRPNYNSVVATFCHNVARGEPVSVNDPAARINLVHVDDVVATMVGLMRAPMDGLSYPSVGIPTEISVGDLLECIEGFRDCRTNLEIDRVGSGFLRALYSTYVSYLPPTGFKYALSAHRDPRGAFVEVLKTRDSGQFAYFTAHPGVTRGGHYHHTKTEKFLVLAGRARFGFRHVVSGERHEIFTSGDVPEIVETVPGWTHDITNVGETELLVMLWANEVFERERPDTYAQKV